MISEGYKSAYQQGYSNAMRNFRKKQEPTTKNDLGVDCISRQAVLDCAITIETDDFSGNEVLSVVDVEEIKALPSVTHTYSDEEIDKAQAVEKAYVNKMVELSVNSVLDKIRAEIQHEYNLLKATRADETLELGESLGLRIALKIIDKYRKESKDKE